VPYLDSSYLRSISSPCSIFDGLGLSSSPIRTIRNIKLTHYSCGKNVKCNDDYRDAGCGKISWSLVDSCRLESWSLFAAVWRLLTTVNECCMHRLCIDGSIEEARNESSIRLDCLQPSSREPLGRRRFPDPSNFVSPVKYTNDGPLKRCDARISMIVSGPERRPVADGTCCITPHNGTVMKHLSAGQRG